MFALGAPALLALWGRVLAGMGMTLTQGGFAEVLRRPGRAGAG